MCINCSEYEYSRNCGPDCTDHNWVLETAFSDEEGWYYSCSICNNGKWVLPGQTALDAPNWDW